MLTREENDLLTRTDGGTPGGEFMRAYWQPAGLVEELPPGGAPLPVKLLGEELVLFRDQQGRAGLLALHCSHRGADLSYGRIEDGGLRCIYHGWLYDVGGRCLEQPGEPAASTLRQAQGRPFHERIRHTAYPCQERAGIIFAYMGPGEPPLLPAYEFLEAHEDHAAVTKYFQECNYLQGNEGNFDPQHLSFLHRFFKPGEADFRQTYHAQDPCPAIEPVETAFGMHLYAIRNVAPDRKFVKVRSFILPSAGAVGSRGDEGYTVNWHVPIDDEHHWRYNVNFRRDAPLDLGERRRSRSSVADNYRLKRNRANRYLQDRDEMKTETFLGMGKDFVVHDTAATESEGQIYDRTVEHLGYTDRGVIALRKLMFEGIKAVQEGLDPRGVVRDAEENHFPDLVALDDLMSASEEWRGYWTRRPRVDQPVGAGR